MEVALLRNLLSCHSFSETPCLFFLYRIKLKPHGIWATGSLTDSFALPRLDPLLFISWSFPSRSLTQHARTHLLCSSVHRPLTCVLQRPPVFQGITTALLWPFSESSLHSLCKPRGQLALFRLGFPGKVYFLCWGGRYQSSSTDGPVSRLVCLVILGTWTHFCFRHSAGSGCQLLFLTVSE